MAAHIHELFGYHSPNQAQSHPQTFSPPRPKNFLTPASHFGSILIRLLILFRFFYRILKQIPQIPHLIFNE